MGCSGVTSKIQTDVAGNLGLGGAVAAKPDMYLLLLRGDHEMNEVKVFIISIYWKLMWKRVMRGLL